MSGLAFAPPRPVCLERAGRLAFAGDPQFAGVISASATSGERHMSVVVSTRLVGVVTPRELPVLSSRLARDLAKMMLPERPPVVTAADPRPQYLENLGPWLADHPTKPGRTPTTA
jgi:hypothetical protein